MKKNNPVPLCLLAIQTIEHLVHRTSTSTLDSLLVVTMQRVRESSTDGIAVMIEITIFTLVNMWDTEYVNINHEVQNGNIDTWEK